MNVADLVDLVDHLPKLAPVTILIGSIVAGVAHWNTRRHHRRDKLQQDVQSLLPEVAKLAKEQPWRFCRDPETVDQAVCLLSKLERVFKNCSKADAHCALEYGEYHLIDNFLAASEGLIRIIRQTNAPITDVACWNGERRRAYQSVLSAFKRG